MQPIEKKKRLHKIKVGILISRAAFLKMPAKTYQCSGTFVEITEQFFITENGQPISGRGRKPIMKKAILIILIFSTQLKSIGQVASPDSSCLQNAKLAQKECNKGIYKFCTSADWDLPFSRMFNILDSLCKINNLIFTPYPSVEHDNGFDPYSCYSNFMDSVLSKKYGEDFKSNLIKKADSIFKVRYSADTVPWYNCDQEIKYTKGSENLDNNFFKGLSFPDSCQSIISYKNNSVYNISFIVDTNGRAFGFQIIHSEDSTNECIKYIEKKLLQSANQFKYWEPAMLGNKKVACHANFFIDIVRRHLIAE